MNECFRYVPYDTPKGKELIDLSFSISLEPLIKHPLQSLVRFSELQGIGDGYENAFYCNFAQEGYDDFEEPYYLESGVLFFLSFPYVDSDYFIALSNDDFYAETEKFFRGFINKYPEAEDSVTELLAILKQNLPNNKIVNYNPEHEGKVMARNPDILLQAGAINDDLKQFFISQSYEDYYSFDDKAIKTHEESRRRLSETEEFIRAKENARETESKLIEREEMRRRRPVKRDVNPVNDNTEKQIRSERTAPVKKQIE